MRLRHIEGAAEFVASNEQVILEQDALAMSGHWQQLFANESPSIWKSVWVGAVSLWHRQLLILRSILSV